LTPGASNQTRQKATWGERTNPANLEFSDQLGFLVVDRLVGLPIIGAGSSLGGHAMTEPILDEPVELLDVDDDGYSDLCFDEVDGDLELVGPDE
jgi:hypothetical protein